MKAIITYMSSELEYNIDQSISKEFQVLPITEQDKQNESYKAVHRELKQAWTPILYERKVISDKAPVIPREQYLFGFPPTEGLCIFTKKIKHKKMLCESPIQELAKMCLLIQGLQYILVEVDNFTVWSYIPNCCCNFSCDTKMLDLELRKTLFEEE